MNKQETAQQLRKVANFFKGLQQSADDIEAIGSMEGATKEARAARDLATQERDKALAELADAKAKGAKFVKDTKDKVEGMLADAQAKADALVAEANERVGRVASDMITKAEAQAADVIAKANAAVANAEQAHHDLSVKRTALAAEVADLETKADTAQAEYDKLTKALDALKAKFKIGE